MPPNPGRRWWFILVALLVASIIYWWQKPQPSVVRNDCQQDHLVIHTSDHDSVMTNELPLVGPIGDLPEFHDCQRFLVPAGTAGAASAPSPDGLAFGPLVAIWAANKLDSAFGGKDALRDMAVPVAVIYDFEAAHGYDPLGIQVGFSCLFLWQDGSWHARLVSLGPVAPTVSDRTRCLDPIPTTSRAIIGGTDLEVRATAVAAPLTPSDIPPVARWDWDAKNRRQYIGIRCDKEWCEVGAHGFVSSALAQGTPAAARFLAAVIPIPEPLNEPTSSPKIHQASATEVLRTVAVKGWYDEQRLDLRDGTTLRMAEGSGIVFPQPALDAVPVEAYGKRLWIPSAYVVLDQAYPRPAKIPLSVGVNRIELCAGTASDCSVPESAEHCVDADTHQPIDRNSPDGWWGRVIPESGTPYYYCVRRRTHDGKPIPVAAARWNWSEADAKTWSACGQACCTGN